MKMIRMFFYVFAMSVFYLIYSTMIRKNTEQINRDGNSINYIVKMPAALKWTGNLMFFFGVFLVILFAVLKLKKVAGISLGHMYIALVFAAIGLVIFVVVNRWKIIVNGDHIEYHPVFGNVKSADFSELDHVSVNGDTVSLKKNGKTLITVDKEVDNYEKLADSLRKNGLMK